MFLNYINYMAILFLEFPLQYLVCSLSPGHLNCKYNFSLGELYRLFLTFS